MPEVEPGIFVSRADLEIAFAKWRQQELDGEAATDADLEALTVREYAELCSAHLLSLLGADWLE